MLIRPTSIIAHTTVESDLRQFTHTLDQQQITDTDCIVPIWHKGKLSQINRKDLWAGMSPWSAYHRDWLTDFTLDIDYLCQGITWYREIDDDGILHAYWFKWAQDQLEHYNEMLTHFETGLKCELVGRYIEFTFLHSPWEGGDGEAEGVYWPSKIIQWIENYSQVNLSKDDASIVPTQVNQALSRFLWLLLVYGSIQSTNGVATALKINLPITGYTRSQVTMIESDIELLRSQGLFVHQYLTGTWMRQNLELVSNDPELVQLLLLHLQYVDYRVTMTTFDTLRERSVQVIQLWLDDVPVIAKPRTL